MKIQHGTGLENSYVFVHPNVVSLIPDNAAVCPLGRDVFLSKKQLEGRKWLPRYINYQTKI